MALSNTPTIIGLTGLAGSGKDTVADLLRTHCGFFKYAFADLLRAEVCEAFGIEPPLLTHRPTKEEPHAALALARCKDHAFAGMLVQSSYMDAFDGRVSEFFDMPRSPRQIMQWWGTEYRRVMHDGYWTGHVITHINHSWKQGFMNHVITDVRFENEAQAVRNMGGTIWQIKRPAMRPITADDHAQAAQTSHVSEVDGSQFAPDVVINNSHDIRHLQAVVLAEWIKAHTGISAQECFNVGMCQVDQASAEWGVYNKALATSTTTAAFQGAAA